MSHVAAQREFHPAVPQSDEESEEILSDALTQLEVKGLEN